MTVSVRIPTILRTYTQDQSQVPADGDTLSAVLDSLESSFPGIKARVVDEQGALRRFVNIYVAEEDVRFANGLDTPTPEGTQISIIPAVAGGSRADHRAHEGRSPAVAGG
jgi:molybdopterin synthase sulfur carrier subunit